MRHRPLRVRRESTSPLVNETRGAGCAVKPWPADRVQPRSVAVRVLAAVSGDEQWSEAVNGVRSAAGGARRGFEPLPWANTEGGQVSVARDEPSKLEPLPRVCETRWSGLNSPSSESPIPKSSATPGREARCSGLVNERWTAGGRCDSQASARSSDSQIGMSWGEWRDRLTGGGSQIGVSSPGSVGKEIWASDLRRIGR